MIRQFSSDVYELLPVHSNGGEDTKASRDRNAAAGDDAILTTTEDEGKKIGSDWGKAKVDDRRDDSDSESDSDSDSGSDSESDSDSGSDSDSDSDDDDDSEHGSMKKHPARGRKEAPSDDGKMVIQV